jgi:hypothetical protein
VPASAVLSHAHRQRPGVLIKVSHPEGDQFAITSGGGKCSLDQLTEAGFAGIDQPLRFGNGKIAHPCCNRLLEWLDPAPGVI